MRVRRRIERRDGRVARASCARQGASRTRRRRDLDRYDVVVDALFRDGVQRNPAARGVGAHRARQRSARKCRGGRRPVRGRRVDGRGGRRCCRSRPHGHVPRAEGGTRSRARPLPRRTGRRRRHRAREVVDLGPSRAAGTARRRAAPLRAGHEVFVGIGARRGRPAWDHERRVSRGDGGTSRRRGLRDTGRAGRRFARR